MAIIRIGAPHFVPLIIMARMGAVTPCGGRGGPGVSAIRELIAKHAAANGVPFKLADAVVRIESTYKPHVSSSAGAMGLMQIKPATARGVGFNGAAGDLYGAETNIRFGMKYLAQVYRQSGGDVCATVMRYQSGAYARHMNAANRADRLRRAPSWRANDAISRRREPPRNG